MNKQHKAPDSEIFKGKHSESCLKVHTAARCRPDDHWLQVVLFCVMIHCARSQGKMDYSNESSSTEPSTTQNPDGEKNPIMWAGNKFPWESWAEEDLSRVELNAR